MYSHLEDYINRLYNYLSISSPEQLTISNIAMKLKLNVQYGTASFRYGNDIILKRTTHHDEWIRFGHEICHVLRHYGNQLHMHALFIDLQEYQANHFAYHFCVPTFMLQQLKSLTVYEIMDLFNVEYQFALYRLEMYKNKMLGGCNYAVQ